MKLEPGEWFVREHPANPKDFFVQAPKINPKEGYDIEILGEDDTNYPTRRADAEFIASAPEIVRQLLFQIEDLEEENVEAEDRYDEAISEIQELESEIDSLRAELAEFDPEYISF